jgi:hypothetical protein
VGTRLTGSLHAMTNIRHELRFRPAVGQHLLDVIRTRFGQVSEAGADGTVLIVENLDQASIRALLTLLWDTGHEVLAFEEVHGR